MFALSTEQLGTLKPPVAGAGVVLEGPALFDEAHAPVDGYYQ